MGRLITPALMQEIRNRFRLDWRGVHGAPQWARVKRHGTVLASRMGADVRVVQLFAVLHDSCREDDWEDHGHGARAAEYAHWLRRRGFIELDAPAFELLRLACTGHSDGHIQADVSVQVCWDADRLDLGRVGIKPDPRYLCTSAAKEPAYLERAWRWSTKVDATQRPM